MPHSYSFVLYTWPKTADTHTHTLVITRALFRSCYSIFAYRLHARARECVCERASYFRSRLLTNFNLFAHKMSMWRFSIFVILIQSLLANSRIFHKWIDRPFLFGKHKNFNLFQEVSSATYSIYFDWVFAGKNRYQFVYLKEYKIKIDFRTPPSNLVCSRNSSFSHRYFFSFSTDRPNLNIIASIFWLFILTALVYLLFRFQL